jgi:hypothetical protein
MKTKIIFYIEQCLDKSEFRIKMPGLTNVEFLIRCVFYENKAEIRIVLEITIANMYKNTYM